MKPDNFPHYVFVDFENVPKVDLGVVEGKPVHVTLLIGKKQTKLDLSLVQQMRRIPAQVELVEVGASGNNALDLGRVFKPIILPKPVILSAAKNPIGSSASLKRCVCPDGFFAALRMTNRV